MRMYYKYCIYVLPYFAVPYHSFRSNSQFKLQQLCRSGYFSMAETFYPQEHFPFYMKNNSIATCKLTYLALVQRQNNTLS